MPFRFVSAAICALLFLSCGFFSAWRMKKRADGLGILEESVSMLRTQVTVLDRPLLAALEAVRQGNAFVEALFESRDPLAGDSWQEAGQTLYLKRQDLRPMLLLLEHIPHGARGETRHFDACAAQLERAREEARRAYEKNGSLHKKLGALMGAAAFILLI